VGAGIEKSLWTPDLARSGRGAAPLRGCEGSAVL